MWSQMKWSHMNVVSNEQVSNVVVSNERGLKWSGLKWTGLKWIGRNCLHTKNYCTCIKQALLHLRKAQHHCITTWYLNVVWD